MYVDPKEREERGRITAMVRILSATQMRGTKN